MGIGTLRRHYEKAEKPEAKTQEVNKAEAEKSKDNKTETKKKAKG